MRKNIFRVLALSLLLLGINGIGHASLTDGLVIYYPFHGDAKDESENGNNGTVNGATLTADRNGNLNNAFYFDGNSYIVSQRKPDINPNGDFTYSLWIRIDTPYYTWNNDAWYLDRNPQGGNGAPLVSLWTHKDTPNVLWYLRYDDSTAPFKNFEGVAGILKLSTWKHYVVVRKYGQFIQLFCDGILVTSSPDAAKSLTPDIPVIGNYGNPVHGLIGAIDEFRIYNRALSESEIQGLFTFVDITPRSLSVTPSNQNVSNTSGTTTFGVSNTGTGTMPWTAAVTPASTWLTITSGTSGTDSGTITCSFPANTSTSARTATVRVTATGATGSPKDVTVTQAPAQPVLSVTPSNQAVSKDAGTTTFSVSNTGTGTMPWTAAVTPASTWLTITSGASGTDSGTINCSFPANTSTSTRTATVRVTAPGATGSPKDVTVTQAPTPLQPVVSVSPVSRDVAKEAGTTTFVSGDLKLY